MHIMCMLTEFSGTRQWWNTRLECTYPLHLAYQGHRRALHQGGPCTKVGQPGISGWNIGKQQGRESIASKIRAGWCPPVLLSPESSSRPPSPVADALRLASEIFFTYCLGTFQPACSALSPVVDKSMHDLQKLSLFFIALCVSWT